jgi:Secretion system C-terminal sorting domain
MKNISKLLSFALLMIFCSSIFAGEIHEVRNGCTFIKKRYKSQARISIGAPICLKNNSSCDGVYRYNGNPTCSENCGFQEAWSGPGGSGEYGYITQTICSRGEEFESFEGLILPMTNNQSDKKIEESFSNTDNIVFDEDNHSVEIKGLSGFIKLQKGFGFLSMFRLTIWQPNDDLTRNIEDNKIDPHEILNKFELIINDKGILLEGDLVSDKLKNKFKLIEDNGAWYLKYENIDLSIPIDKEISLSGLSVRFESDASPDTKNNVIEKSKLTQDLINNNDIKFNLYPNPTNNILNIEFCNKLNSSKTIVEIYDLSGKKLLSAYDGDVEKNQTLNLNVDISSFAIQNFYVLIESNGERLLKQISKN